MVDRAAVVRAALPQVLPEVDVVSSCASVEELLDEGPDVDVVVLDLHLATGPQPGARQGAAAVQAVVASGRTVCIYTQEERPHVLATCLVAGAVGLVSKSRPLPDAQRAFLAVAAGQAVVPSPVADVLRLLERRRQPTLLSPRQREVLGGRARGETYDELARRLHLSPSTLRGYWRDTVDAVGPDLGGASPGDIEHALGLRPGDLVGRWPSCADDGSTTGP